MRWLKFNIVGAIGAATQAGALWLLAEVVKLDYLTATAIAVELAIVHNFVWHIQWTFSDRKLYGGPKSKMPPDSLPPRRGLPKAFLRFQLVAGIISIPGNLAIMWVLVENTHLHILIANAFAIATCATANFLLADRFSFRHSASGSA